LETPTNPPRLNESQSKIPRLRDISREHQPQFKTCNTEMKTETDLPGSGSLDNRVQPTSFTRIRS